MDDLPDHNDHRLPHLSEARRYTSSTARFAMNEAFSQQYIAKCHLSYLFSVATHVEALSPREETFDETDFPFISHIEATSVISGPNVRLVVPWTEAYFLSSDMDHQQFKNRLAYVKPPTVSAESYADA
jgi:hypothetical protein